MVLSFLCPRNKVQPLVASERRYNLWLQVKEGTTFGCKSHGRWWCVMLHCVRWWSVGVRWWSVGWSVCVNYSPYSALTCELIVLLMMRLNGFVIELSRFVWGEDYSCRVGSVASAIINPIIMVKR